MHEGFEAVEDMDGKDRLELERIIYTLIFGEGYSRLEHVGWVWSSLDVLGRGLGSRMTSSVKDVLDNLSFLEGLAFQAVAFRNSRVMFFGVWKSGYDILEFVDCMAIIPLFGGGESELHVSDTFQGASASRGPTHQQLCRSQVLISPLTQLLFRWMS